VLIKVCHKLVEQEQPGYNLQIKSTIKAIPWTWSSCNRRTSLGLISYFSRTLYVHIKENHLKALSGCGRVCAERNKEKGWGSTVCLFNLGYGQAVKGHIAGLDLEIAVSRTEVREHVTQSANEKDYVCWLTWSTRVRD
jgi:hypothetical protein